MLLLVGLLCGHAANAARAAGDVWSAITQTMSDGVAGQQWSALTRIDVEAAYKLLENNHPAALPQVHDVAFVAALANAHAKALARAAKVTSYAGYIATLGGFAGAMGDGHIWSIPLYQLRRIRWAGIIAAKRGADWAVAQDDPAVVGMEVRDARIVSCDGQSAEQLARAKLIFHTTLSGQAEEVVKGGWLLLDDGNPFVRSPKQCTFELRGKPIARNLNWTAVQHDELSTRYWKVNVGQAGFGLRRSGRGYWIALQGLDAKAGAVVDAVAREEHVLRGSPYIVIDLRGDGGGDDAYGATLAKEIYSPKHVAAVMAGLPSGIGCKEVYRASPGNIAGQMSFAAWSERAGDLSGYRHGVAAVRAMKAAIAERQALTGKTTCLLQAAATSVVPVSLMAGKVFVLTDAACFSSCINVVEEFRQLGAIQVGQETEEDTHYMEVRQVVLPSGLSTFSTLQAVDPARPRKLGPFAPRYEYPGDMGATGALESWIETLANKSGMASSR